MNSRNFASALAVILISPLAAQQAHHPMLMISVDGMRPDYVTHADEHGLRIPTLRRMLAEGTHADGVQGVFPTYTYPSHTTLVTGVAPAVHGIYTNTRFDPERKLNGAWYWYAGQIKVPTLWSAVRAAGKSTASVGWPVTVDSNVIDVLVPEYWRGLSPADADNPDDTYLMDAISRPDGELARIAQRTSTPYMAGNDTSTGGDEVKTRYSLDILQHHKPYFMTIHLSSLDEYEHLHGPFSAEANQALESIDGMIQRLVTQELQNYPDAVIAIVSDHGFAHIDHAVNIAVPFINAGLIDIGRSPTGALQIKSWKAQPWAIGSMFAIMLHDADDTATRDKVRSLLEGLAHDPANGIEAILSPEEVEKLGGLPGAAFVVTLKEGYAAGPGTSGPLVTPIPGHRGTHGFNPVTTPAMRASLFLTGSTVERGRDLGIIDMRQIAPTVSCVLGASLPSATQPRLAIGSACRP